MLVTEACESSVEEYAQSDLIFRVYFIDSAPGSTYGPSRVVELSDCDIIDAIGWAQENAATSEVFSMALRLGTRDEAILHWLLGVDGNDVSCPENRRAKELMLRLRDIRAK
ncbi:MAG: hypothetical protein Q4D96_02260 [Propionibacteriaceae bacterium]|nr:hypothetical protein [Propionibacteriaceae bacterium]